MVKPHFPLFDLDKEITLSSLEIVGKMPEWLEGTLLRNGPAKFHFAHCKIRHWFDGLAMLHAFTFSKGNVSYLNKFLRSTVYNQTMQKGKCNFFGFAQDPCRSVFRRFFSALFPYFKPQMLQNANVNIAKIAGEFVAMTETPLPVRFDPNTLQTLGVLDYNDRLAKDDTFESAHPHHHAKRKEMWNYFIEFGRKSHYQIYAIPDGQSKRQIFCSLPVDRPAYMHSFSVTERFFILVEYPFRVNPEDILLKPGGFISNFKWHPEEPAIFNVIERSTGKLLNKFEAPAFFSFHHVNAYEEDANLIVDLISYPDPAVVYGTPPQEQERKLQRFIFDLSTGNIGNRVIAKTNLELPRINYQRHSGKPYCYVYGVDFPSDYDTQPIGLLKIKVTTGQIIKWQEDGCMAGEPIFVSHPDAKEEDDGVLLSLVFDHKRQNSYLLVLEAKSFQEIARATVPLAIPYGLHGMFTSL